MTDTPIKVGIVGLTPERSWSARIHLPALRALPGYDVVAVANSNAESARRAAEAVGIPYAFADAYQLAGDPKVDLVAVTVKVQHHRVPVDAALDAHKMVYCEWPLGTDLADAEAMAKRARDAGVRTAVGLQARSAPTIRYVRDLIRDGYVGEVLSTTLIGSMSTIGGTELEANTYLNDRANGANGLTIPFGHTVDALCWVLGEFREVSATLATRRPTYLVAETGEERTRNVDDQVAVSGVLTNGTVVTAHYRGGRFRATNLLWEINGTEGDLQITAPLGHAQLSELTLHGGRGEDTDLTVMDVPAEYRTVPAELDGPAVTVAEAYARFAEGPADADPLPDFDEAVKRHRLLDAIERSATTGQRITL
ncbi:Oxidoreductase [Frankia sp. AiPs1]|uniref:Gfo/Idh/MocA family protein n=1 Tax=Frankia sp. AiPa1 TaxID=573492 RepID=UPI00202AFFA2|nr:Gfo/Idh/MocA family oxidoreductase [Frankia sp. AiPa1]MCL9761038.1 Gfo/Idh/MocA family oxidoreductase [Frankia sp. AiPa1]